MEHLNLLQRIEQKSSEFSKGQRRLAQYITENYDIAAYLTASKLGKEAGVSESTVVTEGNSGYRKDELKLYSEDVSFL